LGILWQNTRQREAGQSAQFGTLPFGQGHYTLCLLLLPMLCLFIWQQRGGEFAQFGTFPLRQGHYTCAFYYYTSFISCHFVFFIFCFFVLLFGVWSTTGHSRDAQLAPPSKVHWQRARRSSTCTLGYWVWNPGSFCDPRWAYQWAITHGVFVSTVEKLTLYTHSFVNREVFHCFFAFFYSFSLC
jgi:hypothetical protein